MRQIKRYLRAGTRDLLNKSSAANDIIQIRSETIDGAVCIPGVQTQMKIEIILLLYDRLICDCKVGRNAFCVQFGISERTFYRDIREINDFLRWHKSDYVVDLCGKNHEYYMRKP